MQLELVERARRGDHDAFAMLAGTAITRRDAAARLILRDPDQAKDAVQETLVRAGIDEARRLRRHRFDVELTPIHTYAVDDAVCLTSPEGAGDREPAVPLTSDRHVHAMGP